MRLFHAPRGGDFVVCIPNQIIVISIHAPREGGDFIAFDELTHFTQISIHAPREGGDGDNGCTADRPSISIHAPREGGDRDGGDIAFFHGISIHAPREGGDYKWKNLYRKFAEFQSTPPARGATPPSWYRCLHGGISIHAPREGGDFRGGYNLRKTQ